MSIVAELLHPGANGVTVPGVVNRALRLEAVLAIRGRHDVLVRRQAMRPIWAAPATCTAAVFMAGPES